MGTNWFMPALVNSRFGLSGMSEDEGTMVCCFDLKKSRNDWRIWLLVIMAKSMAGRDGFHPVRNSPGRRQVRDAVERRPYQNQAGRLATGGEARRGGKFRFIPCASRKMR